MARTAFSFDGLTISADEAAVPLLRSAVGLMPPAAEGARADLVVRATARGATWRPSRSPGSVPRFFHGAVRASSNDGGHWEVIDDVARIVVGSDGRSIGIEVGDPDEALLPAHARPALFIAFVLALRAHRRFHLHAGAVRLPDDRAALLIGPSGAGKSTTTLALVEAGLEPLGDDAVILRSDGPAAVAVPVCKPFHVDERALGAFPRWKHAVATAGTASYPKAELDLLTGPSSGASPRTPGLLLFLEVGSEPVTQVSPLGQAEALGRMVESSTLLVVDGMSEALAHLTTLQQVAGVCPARSLRLGRDALEDPQRFRDRVVLASP